MARAKVTFIDPGDFSTIYRKGDVYPREGYKPNKAHVARLSADGMIEDDKPENDKPEDDKPEDESQE